nr:class I SAM-dependent methyltransferase [uncultured Campylobacter sp.]
MEKIEFEGTVSETLLINLYFRSKENEEAKPILKDEFSGDVVSKIDYDFAKFDRSTLSRVGTVIRARFFDDCILKFTREHPTAVIIQVGAGLDTRPLRLAPVCPEATFYDLDLPDVIALRDKLMPKAPRNYSLAYSMLETTRMDELARKHAGEKFVFVLEGVSMFFEKPIFREFFLNLAARFSGLVLVDLLNDFATKMNTRKHDTLKFMKEEVKIKMGIAGADEVEAWDKERIKCLEIGTMMNMYKHRWGLVGRAMSWIKPFREACRMFVFALGKRG